MFLDKTVSVVLPTYNERDSIGRVVEEFQALGLVDEVIVVNNNADPETVAEIDRTTAKRIDESIQGYGAACLRGLREAKGDLVALCEPDGTFIERDLLKLLEYARDFDVVLGSRTMSELIWDGANMGWFLRVGNWAVAKMMEMLFGASSLSDVGCTFRIVNRDAAKQVVERCKVTGSHFSPEMMITLIRSSQFKVIQIPVNYRAREGESTITGDLVRAARLGFVMIGLILRMRFSRAASEQAKS